MFLRSSRLFSSPHRLRALRIVGVVAVLAGAAAGGMLRSSTAMAQIYVDPYGAPTAGYGYDPTSGQIDVTGNVSPGNIVVNGTQPIAAPGSIVVNGTQPVATDVYGNPLTTTTTTTYPGATPLSPTTTYVQENTTVPPPNIDGIPYVVAGAEQWVSPGGSYCGVGGGGQVWIPAGASPAVYGC